MVDSENKIIEKEEEKGEEMEDGIKVDGEDEKEVKMEDRKEIIMKDREEVGKEKNGEQNVGKEETVLPHPREKDNGFQLFFEKSALRTTSRTVRKIFYFFGIPLWIFTLGFGICGAYRVVTTTWRNYQDNPTVISMERDYMEWNTSFPAVTICPLEKYDNDSLNEIVEVLPYSNKSELREFLVALAHATYGTFDKVPEFPEIRPSDYMGLILRIKHKFTYAISGSSTEANAFGFLTPTITEHGLCYAFNSDIAIYNSPEYWESRGTTKLYSKGWSFVGSPLDGDGFAQFMDLSSGYTAYIHGPNETADFSSQRLVSLMGVYKTLSITALSIYTTDETKSLRAEQRACRFLEESNLQNSPVYSYNLCLNQCRMNLAYRFCKCVPHFYKPTHGLSICDVKGMHCLARHQGLLASLRDGKTGRRKHCDCLPACNDVNYVIEREHNMPWFLGTNLKCQMINYPKMRLRRDTLFSFNYVLISVGSSIGLFLGCSLLSLIEVLYSMCIRLYRGIRRISKGFDGCILSEISRNKYRYVTSASSNRITISQMPIFPQSTVAGENLDGQSNQFVIQHI